MGIAARCGLAVIAALILSATTGCFQSAPQGQPWPSGVVPTPTPTPRPTPVVTPTPGGRTVPVTWVAPQSAKASPYLTGDEARRQGGALVRGQFLYCESGAKVYVTAGKHVCPVCPSGYSYVSGGNYCSR